MTYGLKLLWKHVCTCTLTHTDMNAHTFQSRSDPQLTYKWKRRTHSVHKCKKEACVMKNIKITKVMIFVIGTHYDLCIVMENIGFNWFLWSVVWNWNLNVCWWHTAIFSFWNNSLTKWMTYTYHSLLLVTKESFFFLNSKYVLLYT